jgi:hypothetical protein
MAFGTDIAIPGGNGMNLKQAILMQTLGLGQDSSDDAIVGILDSKTALLRTEVAERITKLRDKGVSEAEIAYVYTGKYTASL